MQATGKTFDGPEFTGERVIPGLVEADLWNEHISRYRFASLFAAGKRVLDVGCGSGYGTALLADEAAEAMGFDISAEAIAYARENYKTPRFFVGSASSFPVASKGFDLVLAFEVIEHISDWQTLIREAERALTGDGVFLVSTPNKVCYAETREQAGPNPFHVHEFEAIEFREALQAVFPFVRVLAHNRQEAFVFAQEHTPEGAQASIGGNAVLEDAHFFLAVCTKAPIEIPAFSYVPGTGNLLRERTAWAKSLDADLAAARGKLDDLNRELEKRTEWAQSLDAELQHIKRSKWLRLGRVLGVGPQSKDKFHREWLWRVVLLVTNPVALLISATVFGASDLCFALFGKRRPPRDSAPRRQAASIVIPSWNGRELLDKFLPSVVAAAGEHNEIIVVDNASTDGSAEFLGERFPGVRVLSQERNLGFAGGSNAGFRAARNDIVVLLNNDMRVEPDFLAPLLSPFVDPLVFSVSCQIFFSDSSKRREETGLTQSWWERGRLRVTHREDTKVDAPFPCAYPGGGSSAFDRRKFLELGGFDELFRPFYYEDTDLGYLGWKRGWKVIYQPASIVYHEHRATIGKTFSEAFIQHVLKKNAVLFGWKNIHDGRLLAATPRALLQLGEAVKARWRARELAVVSDEEAFRRQLGGYFRDRFEAAAPPRERLRVLFLSPYPIEPPTHGGAVFMKQTLKALAARADVHLISFVDKESQLAAQAGLREICASAQFLVRHLVPPRHPSTVTPHAIREFWDPDFAWAMHRTIYLEEIDVVQIEYTILGQYSGAYRNIPCMLFEHDIFFQSLWRGMKASKFTAIGVLEYIRMLRYELRLLKRVTRVQVCSEENARYLLEFLPELRGRIDPDLRAIVDTKKYRFVTTGRERNSILFVGSFRHSPNMDALNWFSKQVFPRVAALRPEATLVVIGSDAPDSLNYLNNDPNIRLIGFVPEIREPLEQCGVFVCPILSGSGVRVKLLEAFASGIPVVSTTMGAEGLASRTGEVCELADSPEDFARSVVKLLDDEAYAVALAERARRMVEGNNDALSVTARLEAVYKRERLRGTAELAYGESDAEGLRDHTHLESR